MLQFKHFHSKLLSGVLIALTTSIANAALPALEQLAGTWQSNDNSDQFNINTGGVISGLKVPEVEGQAFPNIQINTDNKFEFVYNGTGNGCFKANEDQQGQCAITNGTGTFSSATTVTYTYHYRYDPCANVTTTCTQEVIDRDGSKTATKGTPPVLSFDPPSLPSFADQVVGTPSNAKTVTLRNTGAAMATGIAITLTGSNPGDYVKTTTCTATLAATGTCTISVTFKPTATGTRTATLKVTSTNATQVTANLTGKGINGPVLSLSPTSLTFADQAVNITSAAKTVTLRNTGAVAATGIAITLTGSNPGDYAKTTCTAATLATTTGTCTISVTFKPTATGNRPATLTVTSSNATTVTANLTGKGIGPVLSLSPTSLSFSSPVNITSAAKTVTLRNTGAIAATGIVINLEGNNPGDYIKTTTCGATLAATIGTCTISVTFRPTATGTRTATLKVTSTNATQVTANLTGTGEGGLSLSSGLNISFTDQTVIVGTSATKTVTLTNGGAVAVTGIVIRTTGDFSTSQAAELACATTLAAADNCTIGIAFTPTAAGTRTGTLTITSTNAATVTATLTGTGIPTDGGGGGATIQSVPLFGFAGLSILTMLLSGVVGFAGFRKDS